MLKTKFLFILVTLLICQPMLDFIDVTHHNEKLNQTSKLLLKQVELVTHCEENSDHREHLAEHDSILKALEEQSDCKHCYTCHSGLYLPLALNSTNLLTSLTYAQSLPINFNSEHIAPEHRPPIS